MVTVTALACLERFIGFLYRVYLSRTIGAEALALYQIALSVAGVVITITASGIPVTVSRLMLKERADNNPVGEQEVVSAGILTSVVISLPITLALFFLREKLSFVFADQRCYDILMTILPGITITSVYAVIRGYFWGNREYLKYSLIELIEEIVMAIVGVILVSGAGSGAEGAKRAGTAVFISYVTSFVLSGATFIFGSGRLRSPIRRLKPLIVSSTPITAMRTLNSLTGTVVALALPARLVFYGAETSVALSEFGKLSGMAMPLLFIPSTVIGSIALVIVPEISQSFYEKNKEKLIGSISRSVGACVLISAVIIPVFIACGREIGVFIYDSGEAGVYLSVSAVIMMPMSLSMITSSLLNSINKERKTLLNFIISLAVMFAIIWFAPSIMGVYALIAAYFVNFTITAIMNVTTLDKAVGKNYRYGKNLSLTIASIAASAAFGILLKGILSALPTVVTIAVCSAAVTGFNIALLSVFGVLDIKKVLTDIPLKRKKNAPKGRYEKRRIFG